jgi:hypothetical protein
MLASFTILFVATSLFAANYQVTKKAGDLTVDIAIDRNPPVVGKNNVNIAIKDGNGKAVTDAKVVIQYSMPPMPGMPPMNYKADGALTGNRYRAVMDLSMSGSWSIAVRITRAEKTQTARFTIDVK